MKYMARFFEKHKVIYTLLILLLVISCTLLGYVLDMGNKAKKTAEHEKEKAKSYACRMFTVETLPDLEYYAYMEDGSEEFRKMQAFQKKLRQEDSFDYVIQSEQCLEVIKPEMQDIFLENYELGEAKDSVYEYKGRTLYATKSLQVSEKFFEKYSIKVDEGKLFSKEDYQYDKNRTIPVVLGAAYKKYFKLSDIIEASYLFQNLQFQVIGFLEDTAFYSGWNSDELISCDRYIIMPAFENLPENKFGKRALLQYSVAYIESQESYDQIFEEIQRLKKEYGVFEKSLSIHDANEEASSVNIFQTYSAMTSVVAKYFDCMIGIMIVCIGVILTVVLTNMIQEENYNFGIYIMCGMNRRKLASLILRFDCVIVGCGDLLVWVLLVINQVALKNILLVQLVVVLILLTSFLGCYLRIRKLQVAQLIGGKE